MEKADAYIFLAEGFEEVEALTTVDILRRAGVQVPIVSLTGELLVKGSHAITVQADILFDAAAQEDVQMLILPGGAGHVHYFEHESLLSLIRQYHSAGKYLAAICAAPSVLGHLGLLAGRKATCYPSFEDRLTGASICADQVVQDGHIITSRGPGTSPWFALHLAALLKGPEVMANVQNGFIL